jgi:hypothetical protein
MYMVIHKLSSVCTHCIQNGVLLLKEGDAEFHISGQSNHPTKPCDNYVEALLLLRRCKINQV